jgi:hypothetical protein
MTRTQGCAILIAVLAVTGAREARPDDKDAATKLPVNAVSTAKRGDWCALYFKLIERADQPGGCESFLTWTVAEADSESVTLKRSFTTTVLPGDKGTKLLRGEAPTLETFLENMSFKGGFVSEIGRALALVSKNAAGVKISDEARTVSGKKFAAKKVSFDVPDKGWGTAHGDAWLSAEAPCWGVVDLRLDTKDEKHHTSATVTVTLVGYGNKDSTLWGMTASDYQDALQKKR